MLSVSIIIPVYNRRRFCANALIMLQKQTLRDIEFIIVDDGSTDGTYEYVNHIVGHDKRFVLLRLEKNSGPSVARNKALSLARGRYIGFFDTDDCILPDYFCNLYVQAKTYNWPDIIYCSYNGIKHTGKKVITRLTDKILSIRNGAVWDKLFSSNLIRANKIFFPDDLYCADNVFVFKSFYYAKQVLLTNYPVYQYNLSNDSISINATKAEKRKQDILTIIDLLIEFVHSNSFEQEEILETVYFINRSLNGYIKDKNFQKLFTNKITTLSGKYAEPSIRNQKERNMLMLKLERNLGLIRHDRYEQLRLRQKILDSGLFDKKWYLEKYPDVAKAKVDAVKHYLKHGWKEGRNPSQKFYNDAYLRDNPDVAMSNMCPLVHYINHGYKEGRCVRDVTGVNSTIDLNQQNSKKLWEKIRFVATYPVRVRVEYERINLEIINLQK